MWETMFIWFTNTEKRVENTTCSRVFPTGIKAFRKLLKHFLEWLIYIHACSQSEQRLRPKVRNKIIEIYENECQIFSCKCLAWSCISVAKVSSKIFWSTMFHVYVACYQNTPFPIVGKLCCVIKLYIVAFSLSEVLPCTLKCVHTAVLQTF